MYATGKIPPKSPKSWQRAKQAVRRASARACLTETSRSHAATSELRLARLKRDEPRRPNVRCYDDECNLMIVSPVAPISVPIKRQFSSIFIDAIYAGTFLWREPYHILSKFSKQLLNYTMEFLRTEGNIKFHSWESILYCFWNHIAPAQVVHNLIIWIISFNEI